MENPIGIYKIENILNGDIYIGQTINLQKRKTTHFRDLRNKQHYNKHLQNAWNKYGEENFIFKILLYCEPEELTYYEQSLVDLLNPEYNICKECVVSCLGLRASEETKSKMSFAMMGENNPRYGVQCSEETKNKISIANTGKIISEETRLKLSESNRGRTHSEETKRKISDSNKGKVFNDETKNKMSIAKKNMSDDTKKKISIARIGKPTSEETKSKISEANSGEKSHWWMKKHTEESKEKISEKNMGSKRKDAASIYLGVSFNSSYNKWKSTIRYERKVYFIGYFYNEIDAALAYNSKAIELYGENARLNIIEEEDYE